MAFYVRVTPDLGQPTLLGDGGLDLAWTYKKNKGDDEVFPSSVQLRLDYKAYDTGSELGVTGAVQLAAPVVAQYAGAGAVLAVGVVFHFDPTEHDPLPAADIWDTKYVAVRSWPPPKVPKVDEPETGHQEVSPADPLAVHVAPVRLFPGPFRPFAVSWSEGRIDVFGGGSLGIPDLGSNDGVRHTWYDSNGFHTWENVYGRSPDAYPSSMGLPLTAVSSWGKSRLDLFAAVQNVDHSELVHAWFDGRWGVWDNLGYPSGGGLRPDFVAATSWTKGRIDIVSVDGSRMFHKWFEKRWSRWEDLTPEMGADVNVGRFGIASPGVGSMDMFGFGNLMSDLKAGIDKADLYVSGYRSGDPSPWRPWRRIDVPGLDISSLNFLAAPKPIPRQLPWAVAGKPAEYKYDVFVQSKDGLVWRVYPVDGGIWTYSPCAAPPQGIEFPGGFDVTSWADGRFDLFVCDSKGVLYHYWSSDAGASFIGPELIP